MLAIIETGGKQYKISPKAIIEVEKLEAEEGEEIVLDRVLLISEDGKTEIGSPTVEKATVTAKVIAQKKADKIKVYKMKAKKRYQITQGHRQNLTRLEIVSIKTKA